MATVQTPTKLSRNAPCHCGSGLKYKKCCLPKEEGARIMTKELKNDFRNEVRDPYAGIPEIVLVRRDQAVLMRELRFREAAIEADRKHFESATTKAKDVRIELLALPKSPYRELVIKDLDEQIKALTEKFNTMRLPKSLLLSLLALEELDAMSEDKPIEHAVVDLANSETPEDDEAEKELTVPVKPEEVVDEEDDPGETI